MNYVNFFACILLASDWFKNNKLLSKLTHVHYRDTVPLTVKKCSSYSFFYILHFPFTALNHVDEIGS